MLTPGEAIQTTATLLVVGDIQLNGILSLLLLSLPTPSPSPSFSHSFLISSSSSLGTTLDDDFITYAFTNLCDDNDGGEIYLFDQNQGVSEENAISLNFSTIPSEVFFFFRVLLLV